MPYPSGVAGDGSRTFPFVDLASDPKLVARTPEVKDFPEWADLLMAINAPASVLKSYGCEVLDQHLTINGMRRSNRQGYVDVIFRETRENCDKQRFIDLSHCILRAYDLSKSFWFHLTFGVHTLPSCTAKRERTAFSSASARSMRHTALRLIDGEAPP